MFGTRKLGKTSTQRKALLRQQVTDLLENGKMETALGAEIEVPTLDGKTTFTIPEGTQTGREFVMGGKGIPQVGNPKRRGNHRIFVVVETPTKLTKEQRELLQKLDATMDGKAGPKRKKFFDTLKDFFD